MKNPYQNEHLKAQVEENMFGARFYIFMEFLGAFLCFLSCYNAYKDLATSDETYSYILRNDHPVGLCFGITILLINSVIIYGEGTIYVYRHLHPLCGSVKFTPEEIDELANDPESQWMRRNGLYFTPEVLISIRRGMKAVRYDDIEKILTRKRTYTNWSTGPRNSRVGWNRFTVAKTMIWATSKDSEYDSYQLIFITKNSKKIIMCVDTYIEPEVVDLIKEKTGIDFAMPAE